VRAHAQAPCARRRSIECVTFYTNARGFRVQYFCAVPVYAHALSGALTRVAATSVAVTRIAVTRIAVTRTAVTRVAVTRVAVTRVAVTRVAVTRVAVTRF
jgi:hypothetical protein